MAVAAEGEAGDGGAVLGGPVGEVMRLAPLPRRGAAGELAAAGVGDEGPPLGGGGGSRHGTDVKGQGATAGHDARHPGVAQEPFDRGGWDRSDADDLGAVAEQVGRSTALEGVEVDDDVEQRSSEPAGDLVRGWGVAGWEQQSPCRAGLRAAAALIAVEGIERLDVVEVVRPEQLRTEQTVGTEGFGPVLGGASELIGGGWGAGTGGVFGRSGSTLRRRPFGDGSNAVIGWLGPAWRNSGVIDAVRPRVDACCPFGACGGRTRGCGRQACHGSCRGRRPRRLSSLRSQRVRHRRSQCHDQPPPHH